MFRTFTFLFLILVGANAYAADTATPPAAATPAAAAAMSEDQKIESLLNTLAISDVTFIRNGANMTGKEARDHLQKKWKELQADVHTAQDFIAKVATQSRESGKAYAVKLKDGKEMSSAEWFTQQLKALDGK